MPHSAFPLRASAVAALLCLAAGSLAAPSVASGLHLRGTSWGFAGETGERAPHVEFVAGGRVTGSSGCNLFSGSYAIDGDTVTIGPVVATRCACPPDIMKRESELFQAFDKTRKAEVSGDTLTLRGEDGATLLTLARR